MRPLPTSPIAPIRPVPPWVWLHQSLMADYNRKATAYWWTVVLLGLAAVVHSAIGRGLIGLGLFSAAPAAA